MVQIIKSGTIKVPTQPKDFDLKATGLVFKSYDNRVALEFNVEKQDGTPADLLGANLRLLMFIYDEIDGTVTKEPIPFITKNLITESFLNGHVVYILPEAMKAYNGMVETYVYIEYSDGSTSDNLGFTFRMQRSKIDGLAQDKADYFITDFQQLLDAVKQKAADAVNETLAKVEASSTKMQELEQRIDEQTEIFNNADVYNKAEIEDKLEPFALRTDIDTLDAVKADKKSLALTDSKVADLDSVKADKTALSQTNILLTNGLNSKVDKGGIEQVTLPMLTTEVKKAMTGGSVAVVSDGAVSTSTVVDKAITSAKAVASIQHPQVTLATDPPNYDTETKLLTFPSSGATGGNSVITYGNGAKTYFIPNDGTFSVLNTLPGKTTKLIFDFSTNTMSFIEWNVQLTADQIVLLTMRLNGKHISSNLFPVTVDGEVTGIAANSISGTKLTPVGQTPIVTLVTDPPNYSTLTSTLTFPAQTTGGNSVITYGNTSKYFMIPNDGTFKVVNPLPTKSTKLIFDFSTNTMSFIEWNVNLTKNQAVLLTMRGNGQYISSNIFPVTVDRKMAGIGKDIATNNQVSGSSIQISKDAPIRCIAHRGYSNSYPEDTLVAYRGAKKAGINEVEMDLSWTSDNIPVNIHDSTINRTARNVDGSEIDETINVSNCSLAELKQYEYGSYLSPEFLGEQIPTFEDTLKQCKILDQVLHIDRCWGLGDDRLTILKNVMDKIDYHDVVFYIYHEDSLNRLRNIIPKADVMHLLLGGDITQESIDLCSTYNLSNKRGDGQAQILAKADGVTQAQVQKANNAGVKVNVWGADNADRQQLMSWGVTGFSTNYVNIQDELLDI
ncbi:glycerophosphodiester phosphodiesterase family protein [Enterococcus faecium]|uniref:glycerophosphodiester phosphodiesterase family protein n=1 Tax=Enterococcus faecium TaxID=1352 RepID=UPI00248E28E3|nr:glycerophosphodiester phosphodiesterase family protein [Enterococcus faecium]